MNLEYVKKIDPQVAEAICNEVEALVKGEKQPSTEDIIEEVGQTLEDMPF